MILLEIKKGIKVGILFRIYEEMMIGILLKIKVWI